MNAYLDIGHYWLGLLLSREGNEQEGQKSLARYQELRTLQNTEHTLQMALLRNASDIDTLIRLGQTRYALGKRKEAIATLQRAEKLAPNHPEVLRTFRQWNSD
jgi:cytochrome c-type biogenesis protein CcmH/NrfG